MCDNNAIIEILVFGGVSLEEFLRSAPFFPFSAFHEAFKGRRLSVMAFKSAVSTSW